MTQPDPKTVTRLLIQWGRGDAGALDRLLPLVYDDLRRRAGALMRAERKDHTLQATAVVHEAYARLVQSDVSIHDRGHFFGIAARAMRQVLVDHARSRDRAKRGGGALRVTLGEGLAAPSESPDQLLQLDEALTRLEAQDPRKRKAAEMHLFAGMTYPEIAGVLGVSVPTVQRDMRMALAWLRSEMGSS
jgi:RNA polymerase sigma factor (TIGR02999 family)